MCVCLLACVCVCLFVCLFGAVEKHMKIEAKMFRKFGHNGSKMCENWSKNDSKLPLGGFLGPLWRRWGPCGCPGVPQCSKIVKKGRAFPAFLGPHFGTFLVIVRDFMLFGGCFLGVFVSEPFGDSIFTVLGVIFECFFDAFFCCFFMKLWRQKMWFGLIIYSV